MDLKAARKRLAAALNEWRDSDPKRTWNELHSSLGVNRETVRLWRTGQSFPDLDDLVEVCQFLKTTAEYVLFGTKTERPGLKRIEVTEHEYECHLHFKQLSSEDQHRVLTFVKFLISQSPPAENITPFKKRAQD